MANVETTQLCTQIVTSQFGPLTGTVASVLLSRGRLSLPHIIRLTSLKPRTARAAVLILLQHNILWYAKTDDDGEVLEFNAEECLARLRFGRFVRQADQTFGAAAAEVIQLILDHGKLRMPDILSKLSSSSTKDISVYSQALYTLVMNSYVKPASVLSHVSPRDKAIKYEGEERAKISGFPTAKQLREAKETAEARLKREEEEAMKVGLRKKTEKQSNGRSGKRKSTDEEEVDDEVYFRVNYSKLNVHIRNEIIESAARERFNDQAATVVRVILSATETKQLNVADPRSDPVSVPTIASLIPDSEDITKGLVYGSSKKPSSVAAVKDYLGILSAADNPSASGKQGVFVSFLSSSSGKVQVEFEVIARRLRQRVLESVARERFGDEAVRIIRLLLETGKMDEKQVSKVAMMAAKDARPLLTSLSEVSLISLQEVPKSADRNPTRTFYLWYIDLPKTYSVLLGALYKTLHNIGVRRQAEKEDPAVKLVLDKCERTDVSEDASLLSRTERQILSEWEEKRMKLTALETRVEEAVFILRDFCATTDGS